MSLLNPRPAGWLHRVFSCHWVESWWFIGPGFVAAGLYLIWKSGAWHG